MRFGFMGRVRRATPARPGAGSDRFATCNDRPGCALDTRLHGRPACPDAVPSVWVDSTQALRSGYGLANRVTRPALRRAAAGNYFRNHVAITLNPAGVARRRVVSHTIVLPDVTWRVRRARRSHGW